MTCEFGSLYEMTRTFGDEQACVDHLRSIRWAAGAFCPYCNGRRVYHFKDGRNHKCGDCRQRFSIKVGTIFEDSKVPMSKWFMAIYLITSHKKGAASAQLARDIKVTQKTAWFMLHRLRHAAMTGSFNRPLAGDIEADETYVGGKEKNKHASKRQEGARGRSVMVKTPVFAMLKRGGEVRAKAVPDATRATLLGEIGRNVRRGSVIHTDGHSGYAGLEGFGYGHRTVRHAAGEFVRDGAGVNGAENFFSLFKRAVVGIYHHVSRKHMNRYLAMASFRFNTREDGEGQRVNRLLSRCGGRLTYKTLIA